jgi:DNA-binding LacI/PurR family transcriptional regulator
VPGDDPPRAPARAPGRPRRRIGVLLGDPNEECQAEVLRGVRDGARERGLLLRSFVGGELGSDKHDDRERNSLYGMVGPENVDGLIVMAGAIANFCGRGKLAEFCARFERMPMCTISGELPGVRNVLANNGAGVREALSHLINVHHRRKIGFIQGPDGNQDAHERYRGYVEALTEGGLDLDTSRVMKGDFSIESGECAIAAACTTGTFGERIDSLMAADDSTAVGALRELARRKIAVPQEVSVIGFDDVQEARITRPPLTTIRQPFPELGAEAVRIVCALLDGEKPPMRTMLPTRAVFRRSCGCQLADGGTSARPPARRSFEAELIARKDVVRARLQRATRGAFGAVPKWDDRLTTSFAEQLRSGSDQFLVTFRAMLEPLARAGTSAAMVDAVLNVLREQMIACLGQDTELTERLEDLIREARVAARGYSPSSRPRSREPSR